MATVFTDRAGYRHTSHTLIRDTVVAYQVWTSDADGWYIGARQLLTYPLGHETVPEGSWVFLSDYAPHSARVIPEATARRLIAAWAAAGTDHRWLTITPAGGAVAA